MCIDWLQVARVQLRNGSSTSVLSVAVVESVKSTVRERQKRVCQFERKGMEANAVDDRRGRPYHIKQIAGPIRRRNEELHV